MTGSSTPSSLRWRKASASGEGNCLEVAELPGGRIAVRDNGDPTRTITCTRDELKAFILGVKAGEFDDLT
jgi:hypothetical protein